MPEDRQQPRPEIRARSKMPEAPEGPDVGFLDEIIGFRRVPREPASGALERREVLDRLPVDGRMRRVG